MSSTGGGKEEDKHADRADFPVLSLFIDPGQNLHWRKLDSLIPHSRWPQADLILVTHGDADYAEFVPRAARASGAPIVCGPALAEKWLRKGLDVVPLAPGQTAEAAGIDLKGIKVQRGGPTLTLLGRSFTFKPKFAATGLTAGPARRVKPPIIQECMAHLECRAVHDVEAGDHNFVIGEVLEVYARPGMLNDDGLYDLRIAHPLLHLGRNRFTSPGEGTVEPPLPT